MRFLRQGVRPVFIAAFLTYATATYAEPWYSGPLLSEPAIVTPVGHGYLQVHAYKINNYGAYNENFGFYSLPRATTGEVDTQFNYGLTGNTEAQLLLTYLDNKTEGRQASNLGDTTITIASQLLLQNGRKWPPNIKFMFRQLFPTGRFDQLNSELFGTDATGQGSYLTTFAMNMEHVTNLWGEHYLIEFATIAVTLPSTITLNGFSLYGGGRETHGTMWPGNEISFNLAVEYSPSQHWGFILESFILAQKASHFRGHLGPVEPRFGFAGTARHRRLNLLRRVILNRLRPSHLNLGSDQLIGHGNVSQFTLIPAIDYSFTKNVSLTGGVWFTVAGKNSPAFYTPMLSFTGNW